MSHPNPKFIINNGNLTMGHVEFHRELSRDHSTTKGGGWFHLDKENKKLYLYDESMDFGPCARPDVQLAVTEGLLSPFLEDFAIYFLETHSLETALERAGPENQIK
jgi:hypothetical protein